MDFEKEKLYLEYVEKVLDDCIFATDRKIEEESEGLVSDRKYIWDTFAEMDETEQSAIQGEAHIRSDNLVSLFQSRNLMDRQKDSPFWGKIKFKEDGATDSEDIYIGIGTIADADGKIKVVDWRAPVGDLYYNFELGNAEYKAPSGTISGEIEAKVQHKIKNGELKFAIDTTATITDEILIRELSKNTSALMKNIASTIQREQNEIIRYPIGENILVQGVAGSGKTSIALHRVAYILYNYRGTIKAKDILIISPNKAFSGYISNVLPELGEQNVVQISLETLAQKELERISDFESRTEYLEDVYEGKVTEAEIADIKYKSSPEFVSDIKSMVKFVEKKSFKPRNFIYRDFTFTKESFEALYSRRLATYPPLKRFELMVEHVENAMIEHFHTKRSQSLHIKLTELLAPTFKRYSVRSIYETMLKKLKEQGRPVIVPDSNSRLPFEDVNGILLLKVLYEGTVTDYGKYKHVVVDEMQDYIPTQYALINKLFKCHKDVLGDMNQIVDPYMNIGSLDIIKGILGEHKFFSLETSYRSTAEIIDFANGLTDQHIKAVDRHGEKPEIIRCNDLKDEAKHILEEVDTAINKRGYGSVAIIARDREHARALYEEMKGSPIGLLIDSGVKYQGGIILTTATIVKGFEFDEVIVAGANSDNYSTDFDRHILFVACTRALHSLKLYYSGEKYTC